jgi:hypothetical protein
MKTTNNAVATARRTTKAVAPRGAVWEYLSSTTSVPLPSDEWSHYSWITQGSHVVRWYRRQVAVAKAPKAAKAKTAMKAMKVAKAIKATKSMKAMKKKR